MYQYRFLSRISFAYPFIAAVFAWAHAVGSGSLSTRHFDEILAFTAEEAHQGVAVDEHYFYAIGSRSIGKYDKITGKAVVQWKDPKGGAIIHLDSGMVRKGRLYCAHSNYPGIPMTSSVEIWDTDTLEHVGSYSFGIAWGSLTWIDWHEGHWWAVFANYDKLSPPLNTHKGWTTLVRFDGDWNFRQSWVFPEKVVDWFDHMSNSGGSWGPDGKLYITGHDRGEVAVLSLPNTGSILELVEILPLPIAGQGIAWDRSEPGVIYGIRRKSKTVVALRLVTP